MQMEIKAIKWCSSLSSTLATSQLTSDNVNYQRSCSFRRDAHSRGCWKFSVVHHPSGNVISSVRELGEQCTIQIFVRNQSAYKFLMC